MKLTEPKDFEFKEFMERVQKKLAQVIRDESDQILSTCYTDYAHHISSDAWMNYRNDLKIELQGGLYKQVTDSSDGRWAKNVRDMIFLEHKEELIVALNQDLLNEIARLKEDLNRSYRRFG